MVYSTKSQGIGGKIKLRYSDFIVEEIATDGRVAKVERFLKEGALDAPTKITVPENPEAKDFLHFDPGKIQFGRCILHQAPDKIFAVEPEAHRLCGIEGQARNNLPAHFALSAAKRKAGRIQQQTNGFEERGMEQRKD